MARKESVPGGGKDASKITDQYEARRQALIRHVSELLDPSSRRTRWFADHALFWVGMDPLSLAPTYVPSDLFHTDIGIRIVAPWYTGYVIEIPLARRDALLQRLRAPSRIEQRVDISRIDDFRPLHETIAADELRTAWSAAALAGDGATPSFVVSLAPFDDVGARDALIDTLGEWLAAMPTLRLGTSLSFERSDQPVVSAEARGDDVSTPVVRQPLLNQLRESYRTGRYPRVQLSAPSFEALIEGSGRGVIVRWDPVTPLSPARPGAGPDPELGREVALNEPIVGHIDGGLTALRYLPAVAWQEDPFLPGMPLDTNHGNCTAALLVEAHGWNNELILPTLYCRLGVVPAVPRDAYAGPWDIGALVAFLDRVVGAHPDTHVWNISANLRHACDRHRVSEFGHQLSMLARRYGVLFVVSTGNRSAEDEELIAPPADAEAALTVAGRLNDVLGYVGDPCPISRVGLGPDDMLKPELSWYSVVRLVGGRFGRASSFAAPLVSRLCAHTWHRLRQPSSDMVKALLITAADGGGHHYRLGYGSPTHPHLPWETDDNAVIFCWQGTMTEKLRYYWSGIEIPLSLRPSGRFRGRVRLVSILEPATHMRGTNYTSTRLEAALQYQDGKRAWKRLAGSLPSETAEGVARTEDAKWQPMRFYDKECPRGVTLGSPELRLSARLYWRDRYLYPHLDTREAEAKVTFVVMLESFDRDARVYEEFVDAMGAHVERAVIEPDIEIHGEG